MEMQQVRYFLAVARSLNFTRAAEDCSVTQPALTRAIKQLEEELGGDLLRREGRLSHLTDLGHRMLPLLQQCYDSALTAKTLAAKVKKGEVAALTLAVSRSLDLNQIITALAEMHRTFPGLQFKLRRGTGAQLSAMLKNGDVDLAIGGPMGEHWDRLESWPMFSETFDLVVAADHALAGRNEAELDIELIRQMRFLVHGAGDASELDTGHLATIGFNLNHAHEVDSEKDLETLVVAHFGLAIVPASTMNTSRVRHLNFSALDLQRTVAVYSVAGRPRTREASALLTLVRSSNWSASAA